MKIFSGSANKPLAEKVAKSLDLTLSETEIHIFPDGEKRVRILDTVVDKPCIVVQPTSPPVDTNYMELFFLVDAIKRSGAAKITVVMSYVGYQRQDHVFRSGEAVSLDVVIKTLETTGVSAFIAFDFHSIKTQELFHIKVLHLSALPLFAEKIKTLGNSHAVLVSPDMGGQRRIKILSELLGGMPYVAIEKNRDLATGSIDANVIHGELRGAKQAVIVDDMISSGKTIAVACDLLEKKGIEEIFVFATHPVFSDDAPKILEKSMAQKIYVTDTVFVPKEKQFPKLEILSVAPVIAEKLYENS
ncbi:ribose-phosphate pyrophosphokinase [Candidatus Shapirobacteria bacterium]|nr:ribose-phosphate pyrophosphokinase [Candidatus Shapirobacteria bacterium]